MEESAQEQLAQLQLEQLKLKTESLKLQATKAHYEAQLVDRQKHQHDMVLVASVFAFVCIFAGVCLWFFTSPIQPKGPAYKA